MAAEGNALDLTTLQDEVTALTETPEYLCTLPLMWRDREGTLCTSTNPGKLKRMRPELGEAWICLKCCEPGCGVTLQA